MEKRAGAYYWAGPGTIRMIRQKFFRPRIDEEDLMRSYDLDRLSRLKDTLGLTDAWVTWSWGFSRATEAPDRSFLRRKLENFKRLGIRTHAYVQGTNLVFDEHKDADYYCRDDRGQLIPYHRGRKLCCPNNPAFRRYLVERVREACAEDVDGVFMDNLHFGQFPIPLDGFITFFGCRCTHCATAFREATGWEIPRIHHPNDARTKAYIRFRSDSMHALLGELRAVTRAAGKEFGSNGLDLNLDTNLFYGYDLQKLQDQQDYLLVENFNHPLGRRSNARLAPILETARVPVFIVSYKKTIGGHGAVSQRDLDAVHTESKILGYHPCYKCAEFTTDKVWHNLKTDALRPVREIELPAVKVPSTAKRSMPLAGRLLRVINRMDRPMMERIYERRYARVLLGWVIDSVTMRQMPSLRLKRRAVREA